MCRLVVVFLSCDGGGDGSVTTGPRTGIPVSGMIRLSELL